MTEAKASEYRTIEGLPAPVRLETPFEAQMRYLTYPRESRRARLLLRPGKAKFFPTVTKR